MRMMTASKDVVALVDQGADVDVRLKNLTVEDKVIKAKLANEFEDEFEEGETSVKVMGEKSCAVLTACESASIDASAETFPAVRDAIDGGMLDGVVERKLSLVVPQGDVERAKEILNKSGLMATVTESLSVKAETLRSVGNMSVEQAKAVEDLKRCVKTEVSYRVKYDKKA